MEGYDILMQKKQKQQQKETDTYNKNLSKNYFKKLRYIVSADIYNVCAMFYKSPNVPFYFSYI